MANRINPKAERAFLLTVKYLRGDLETWEQIRDDDPDGETVQEFRMFFTRQISRLEKMAKRGIVTPQSRELIQRARQYLVDM